MAQYCFSDDLKADIQNTVFTATTRPSVDQVDTFCTEISQEIDAILLANSVRLPVTDSNALILIKRVAIAGVVSRVYFSMGQALDKHKLAEDRYQAGLTRLEKNPWIANPNGTRDDAIFSSFPQASSRVFQKGARQW